jgi:hypothetical protein
MARNEPSSPTGSTGAPGGGPDVQTGRRSDAEGDGFADDAGSTGSQPRPEANLPADSSTANQPRWC